MIVNGIPKSERIWVRRLNSLGEIYYITSNGARDYYFLYKYGNNKAVRIGKAKTPLELEIKYLTEE